MKTIVFAANKGGTGKTTLCAALATAVRVFDPEVNVAIADLDPQGSLTRWWNLRSLRQPALLELTPQALAQALEPLREAGLDLLLLDCPPGIVSITEAAIACADLVLIPTGPGDVDLAAVASTVQMAEAAGKPYRYVLNRGPFRTKIGGQAVTALREGGKLLCLPVHARVGIVEPMGSGLTAVEVKPRSPAAREMMAVWLAARALLGWPPVRWPADPPAARRTRT